MKIKEINESKGFLSSTAIKYIAIIAMTFDHYAWLFPTPNLTVYTVLHFIGRLTAPLMCFFLTEGYHYTSNLKKYFIRLAIFAVISQAPFMFFFYVSFGSLHSGSMILTLFICLLSIHIFNTDKVDKAFKFPAILFLLMLVQYCDWGADALYFTLAFEFARDSGRKKQVVAYSLICLYVLIPVIQALVRSFSENWYMIYNLGMFIPAIILLFYNGKRGGSKSPKLKTASKYFFYIYYPLHIFILTFIRYLQVKS